MFVQDSPEWNAVRAFTQVLDVAIEPESDLNTACQAVFNRALSACHQNHWDDIEKVKAILTELSPLWGHSLLTYAISTGDARSAQHLIERRINILFKDHEGNTALHHAAQANQTELIEKLYHIDVNEPNNEGFTPLHLAIRDGHKEAIEKLIERGADLNRVVYIHGIELNALGLAVMWGQKSSVDALWRHFRRPAHNLAHIAIFFHQMEVLKHLLQNHRGDLIEGKDQEGLTPISYAALLGQVEAIGILIHYKADFQSKDRQGRLPIHYAAEGCFDDCIQLLAHYGSKFTISDSAGNKPIDLVKAQQGEQAKICENLLKHLERAKRVPLPTPRLLPPQNLVFRGGGPKGLAYAGALDVLEQEGVLKSVERVAGTSAGAITAGLLAVGFPIADLEDLLRNLNLMTLLDHPFKKETLIKNYAGSILQTINTLITVYKKITSPVKTLIGAAKSLYQTTGLCEGEVIRNLVEDIIHKQTKTQWFTFGDLRRGIEENKSYKHFVSYGTRVGGKPEIVEFGSFDPKWDNAIISDVIRISMSIPGVFKPHCIHFRINGERIPAPQHGFFLDGGMLHNFPIEAFDQKRFFTRSDLGEAGKTTKPNPRTLGFSLYSSLDAENTNPANVENIGDLLLGIAKVYYGAENAIRKLHPDNLDRVIEIDVKDVGTLSFNMEDEKKEQIILSGKEATQVFFARRHLTTLPPLLIPTAEEIALGPAHWQKHFRYNPEQLPLPETVSAFLKNPCPFWPGKKRFETHIIALIPKIALKKFIELQNGTLNIANEEEFDSKADRPYWIAFTKNTIPGSYNKTFEERLRLLPHNYVPSSVLETAICTSFEYLENAHKLFSDTNPNSMRWVQCVEEQEGDHLCVGRFDHEGISVFSYPGKKYGGIVGVFKF